MQEPYSPPELRVLCQALVMHGTVRFSRHAVEEMAKDNLNEVDALNVIRGGAFEAMDLISGTWRYRIGTSIMVVVVAFPVQGRISVVTAWRKKR